ncbi:hypothetical protein A2Y85_07770, partial [candidate division WOR-3 bacterium RBG_13_43_14]
MKTRRSLLLLFILLVTFCSRPEKETVYKRFIIGANCEIKFYCDDSTRAAAICNKVDRELFLLDSLLSRFSDISLVSKINKDHQAVLTQDLIQLFELCDSMSVLTSGRFDISIAPLVELWGFYKRNYQLPDSSEIDKIKKRVNHARIKIVDNTIIIPDNMLIDLGGIAQGYVADRITDLLKKDRIEHALINIGGEIAAVGRSPRNKSWRIGIKHPRKNGIIEIVELENYTLSTSGDYEK